MNKQVYNSVSALTYQIISLIVGLIIPKIMIQTYGSNLYGLSASITQFLSYIVLIEGGLGGVVKAHLYKALAACDNNKISSILKATENYFRQMAFIFVGYILLLAYFYPKYINSTFDMFFTGSLIIIIALSSLAQYYFGITYSVLLQADQKLYVTNVINVITLILNSVFIIVLINLGISFHIVKLVSTAVFILRPMCLCIYVNRNYRINHNILPDTQALSQRWNGLAHHIAWFLHDNTDVVIITIFCSLSDVSIYSIYYFVAKGVVSFATALVNGTESLFGNIMASEGEVVARKKFSYLSMSMNCIVIIFFSVAGVMIMPFINIYTQGIKDANYYLPLLGYILLLAECLYCFRIPYHSIVTAAGHFKQTQTSAILETMINIVLSVILVKYYGLPGVAMATAIAMLYRIVFYIWYLSNYILKISFVKNICHVVIALLSIFCFVFLKCYLIGNEVDSFFLWVLQSCCYGILALIVSLIYAKLFYSEELMISINAIKSKF